MNLFDILDALEKVLPVLGTMTGNPVIGSLAAKLLDLGEEELRQRMAASGKTRTQELSEAAAAYTQFKIENPALRKKGHEADG